MRCDPGTDALTADTTAGRLALDTFVPPGRHAPPAPVLVFGAVPDQLDPADAVTVDPAHALRVQLGRRFDRGLITAGAWEQVAAARQRRLLVHNLVTHLGPGAHVWIDVDGAARDEAGEHARSCGLEPEGAGHFRRTARTTIHDLVAEARARLVRTTPAQLAALLVGDPGCVVLDTRTPTDRERLGTVPGSLHVPRTTLEWRVDPSSGYCHRRIRCFEQRLVVMCGDGYSSSLAAATLQRLGFGNATDLVGGFTAWRDAGLPVEHPRQRRRVRLS